MEFTSQICTSREQSERLLALGLKKGTADMKLIPYSRFAVPVDYYTNIYGDDPDENDFCRAWSLYRLIEIADTYIEFSPFTGVNFQDGSFSTNRDNDYDAIIDIIEWLIQKEHFNKEYLEEK